MRRTWKVGQKHFIPGVCLCLLLFLSACQKNSSMSVGSLTPTGTTSGTGSNLQSPTAVPSTPVVTPTSTLTPTTTPTSTLTPTPSNQATSSGPVPSGSGTIPSGLPRYFSFGISNSPGAASVLDDQRSQNGTAFAFRYQYLTGGVNTGHGWETWNQPAGQFATYYMQESAQHSYIPALVFYELCPSNGPVGSLCGKQDDKQDAANIADPTVMKAYYANWVLLLQKVGAFGKPVLIIVEPDLWGFLQSSTHGGDNAASVSASVSSSGYPDAAGYPNTAQGFAWALLHMRDTYARNAILAINSSPWGTGTDIGGDTSSSLDLTALAQRDAKFLNSAGLVGNPAGVSTWDLISNDVADRDSAQANPPVWWDRYNRTFPNFSRFLSFISLLTQDTHRRVVMWQVPVGNQYFDTMNNTTGHYQDNRAEYILGHVSDFASAGIIGVLFGSGQSGGTANTDAMKDGVTNPAPISTYECNDCNNHTSSYPDDDGGYLRIFIGAYMKKPVMLS